jgi:hypothetical protein
LKVCTDTYGFQVFFQLWFLSLKTHVCWNIWFSSFIQLWIFELENTCVLAHMVFKLGNQSLKKLENHMHWISKLENPCALAHMIFKLVLILDFLAWKPMCIWFFNSLQLWIFEFENTCVLTHMVFKFFSTLDFWASKPMCISTYGFDAIFNFGLPSLISNFILFCHCF